MVASPTPDDEDRRLEALHGLGILDTVPDPRFDRIARLACAALRVPIAWVCLIDSHRQWFKSRLGLDVRETAREISFCSHAILRDDALIVTDTWEDLRFADNPLVTGNPHARFYAGHPIRAPEGALVGTLCVIDTRPRHLSAQEITALADLAALVDSELLALRSEEREQGQQQKLRETSHQAGMAEMATGVLHNIGNVVNSLGISHATMRRNLKALRIEQLSQATALIRSNRANLSSFLTVDECGQHLPEYLPALSAQISANVQTVQTELASTEELLEHLRDIISAQQEHAHIGVTREPVDLAELLDGIVTGQTVQPAHIEVVRRYENLPPVTTDRHKLMLILVNLLNNARDAVLACGAQPGRIVLQLSREVDDAVVSIEDSGVGMSREVLSHIWRFGFTTKPNGKGFDLHNSANAAREIGATLLADSEGRHKGSRFIVRLPIITAPSSFAPGAERALA